MVHYDQFKFCLLRARCVAYAVQIYELHTHKSVNAIEKKLEDAKKRPSQTDRCSIVKVERDGSIVMTSLKARVGNDLLYYDITIRPSDGCLIVQGSGIGKNVVNEFLAQVIEHEPRSNVISEHILSIEQSIQLFKNITKEDDSNFIMALKVQFEPEAGYEYARETYQEIAYKFTENRCASKHRDFNELRANGKRMHMSMRLYQCVGLVTGNDKSLRMDITPSCRFRLYTDRPVCSWNEFCFKIVDFL